MDTGPTDDPHRQPKDRDRGPLVDRIRKAADEGRIGTADRDIRIGNVQSAQSVAELDLIARDLDLLEQTLAPGSAPFVPPVSFPPAPAQPTTSPAPGASPTVAVGGANAGAVPQAWTVGTTDTMVATAKAGATRVAFVLVAVVALVVVAAGALAYFAVNGSPESSPSAVPSLFSPEPVSPTGTAEDPGGEPSAEDPGDPGEPATPYALTGPGIRSFLAAYRQKFSTTKVVELTLYDDYAIVQVPVAGKNRHAGWLYRPGNGWSDFGGVTANFPGSAVVDTTNLDVPALLRNIGKARRTLNVEDINMTYVILNYRPQFDEAPNANVYVTNQFHESGYLATTLDGRVERAYPFAG